MTRIVPRSFASVVSLVVATACASAPVSSTTSAPTAAPAPPIAGARRIRLQGDFKAPLGVQLYTFRVLAKQDPVEMLHTVGRLGFTHVEGGSTYGMSLERYAQVLKESGLRTTSVLTSVETLRAKPDSVIAQAKALGAKYVGTAWYPHQGNDFTEADARKAIAEFNAFGRTMKAAGLTFIYHNHGYEPHPYGDGTLLDLIIRETDPELVKFEMDVLWTWLPGVDPVALLEKYPGRFRTMHIKDMKPGLPRGSLTGALPEEEQTPPGTGQVNWPALMKAAERAGIEYYYIEDETPTPLVNVPKTIDFFERLKY
jgi:sugar phosphate isomerase/epimerase